MTCDDAKILLLFYRPARASELIPDDVAAVEAHLAGCPACAASFRGRAAVDAAVGGAVRAVPVAGKAQILARTLAAAGRAARLRWGTRAAAAGLAAAVSAVGFQAYADATRPALDTWAVAADADAAWEQPEKAAREWLAREGVNGPLPEDFDFRLLTSKGTADVNGVRVLTLEFRAAGAGFARVHLVRPGQLATRAAPDAQNSTCTVRVYRDKPVAGWTAVVVYTGNGLQPFLRVPAPAV